MPAVDDRTQPNRRQAARWFVPAVLALAALVVAFTPETETVPRPEDIARLLDGSRPFEPRISGGYQHAPCQPGRQPALIPEPRCGEPPGARTRHRLARLVMGVPHTPVAPPGADPKHLHVRGLVDLLSAGDDVERFDRAVSLLEKAAAASPDAAVLADLAAAFMVRAQRASRPFDLIRALDAALRAVQADRDHPEAAFNLAQALERLALHHQAVPAWRRVVELAPDDGWAAEARRFLAGYPRRDAAASWEQARAEIEDAVGSGDLESARRLIDRHRQQARLWGQDELLGRWAVSAANGDTGAASRALMLARTVGETLRSLTGDALLLDAVAEIEQATASVRAGLVAGHRAYREGVSLIAGGRYAEAVEPLDRAVEHLESGGNAFVSRAAFQRLRCDYQAGKHGEVLRAAEPILEVASDRYSALAARTRWVRSTSLMLLGRLSEAAEGYRESRDRFVQLGEVDNEIAATQLLAGALEEAGDPAGGRRERYRALAALDRRPDDRHLRITLTDMALDAAAAGALGAALALQSEVVTLADARGSPLPNASALLYRAAIHKARGDLQPAIADLERAKSKAEAILDPDRRETILANLAAVEGRVLLELDLPRALRVLDQGIERHRSMGFALQLPSLLQVRAQAHRLAGARDAAIRDLDEAIALVEHQRGHVESPLDRIAFLDQHGSVIEERIALALEVGDPEDQALVVSERGRARLLLDWLTAEDRDGERESAFMARTEVDHRLVARAQARLGAREAMLVFEVLEDRTIAWILRRETIVRETLRLRRADLEERVDALRRTRLRPSAATLRAAEVLHDTVLGPLRPALADAERWIIVPDESLFGIPFNALRDPATQRFVVEDASVAITPSLAVFARNGERPDRPVAGRGGVVAIVDPVLAPRHAKLEPLRGATPALATIRAIAPDATVLEGQEATRSNVLAALPSAQTLFVVAHALADPRHPLQSAILMAPGQTSDTGLLTAGDLLEAAMSELRLVVLSACRTAGTEANRSEALLGLVWPFIAHGVEVVIASPIDVEDGVAGRLSGRFFRATDSPAIALRRSQLSLQLPAELPALAFQGYG